MKSGAARIGFHVQAFANGGSEAFVNQKTEYVASTGGTPVTQPPVEQPPVEQPPVEQPPVEQPPVEQPPVEQPPVEQPPVEQPPVENPTKDQKEVPEPTTILASGLALAGGRML